jgi:hypothetical protein
MKNYRLFFLCALMLPVVVSAKTNSVIEEWSTSFFLPKPNDLVIKEFFRIKILNEDGYGNAIYYDYYDSFRKIRNLKYTIFDASGNRVKKLSKADAFDVMLNYSYETADARSIILEPDYRSYPFTVEVEVEIAFNGFLAFPVWMPRFTHDLEVKQATLVLECYKDFSFKARELNGVALPVVENRDGMKVFKWSLKNLMPVEKHLTYKSFAADQPKVHLTPFEFTLDHTAGNFASWTDFGEWYFTLNKGRNTLSDKTQKYLTNLQSDFGNDSTGLVREIYKYMQSHTRYVSIQLGIGGYRTIPADDVEKTGYGDCKALTNYMKAMLDYLKIPSNPVLVYAGGDVPEILNDFPSNQFNHVFLAVPQRTDTLWFECTSQTVPPAHIGTFTDDRYALWIDENKSNIIRTPVYSASESVRSRQCAVEISDNGNAELQIAVSQSGFYFDEVMYYEQLASDKISEYNYRKFHYKDFTIKSFKFNIPDKNVPVLNIEFGLAVNGFGKSIGGKMVLPFTVLSPFEKDFNLDYVHKKAEIRRAFTIDEVVSIKLPPNYRVDLLPDGLNESTEFGTIVMTAKTDERNYLHVTRKAVINKGKFEKESFDRFNNFLKKVRTVEQSKIVLLSKT